MNNIDIIFLHGSMHGAWCWNNFVNYLNVKGHRTFAIDFKWENSKEIEIKDYIDILDSTVKKCNNKVVLVAHSMGSLVALNYAKFNSNKVYKIILISPLPIKNVLTSMMFIGIKMLTKSRENLFFSENRVDNKEYYINKLRKDPIKAQIQVLKGFKTNKSITSIPSLVLTSWNDNCVPVKFSIRTGKRLKSKIIVLNDICHDMMLDNDWEIVAKEIYNFLMTN